MSSGKAGQSGITLVFSDSKSGSGNLTYMSSMIRKCPSCCTTAWDWTKKKKDKKKQKQHNKKTKKKKTNGEE